ncbi:unnamed protein product [Parnassius apollo]|uniref:(apollo) hypothetical protein n=1 Tax=Parnassius apollo TaxID=110799 RepID=A0A8S3XLV6_PARAO|nr:unnamed protein product [Parnassius apollo]
MLYCVCDVVVDKCNECIGGATKLSRFRRYFKAYPVGGLIWSEAQKFKNMEKKRDSFFLQNKNLPRNSEITIKKPYSKNDKCGDFDQKDHITSISKKDEGKKTFDKKAYRLKKYSKKYKLKQWEEKRKKKLLYDYHKSIKNDPLLGSYKPKSFDEDNVDNPDIGKFVRHPDLIKEAHKNKKDAFQKAKEHYEKIKQEKVEKQRELEKSRQERAEKIQEYKKKKQERFKKLSKKTKKGQPVMTGRLELLLEKIQNE